MFDRILTNWKTSIAGVVLFMGQYLQNQGSTGFTWKTFLPTLGSLFLGLFSKDK